jgi:hypothetical protein
MSHAKDDAEKLFKAMKGAGTDEKALIEVIGHRSKEDLHKIAQEYKEHHKEDLVHAIRGDTSHNFEELLVLRVLPRVEVRKWLLTRATKGAGTAEKYLVDVLAPATNAEVLEVYQNDPTTIARVLNDVSHGDFAKVIHEVLKGKRDEGHPDDHKAKEYAEKLYKAGEGKWGTDENVFVQTLTTLGPHYLHAVSQHYEKEHKHSLAVAIQKETSGHFEDLLVGLTKTHLEYYADRLFSAMHGAGTDEHALNFIFGILSHHEIKEVAKLLNERHKRSLDEMVKSDTSGTHRDLLVALMQASDVKEEKHHK